MTPKEYLICKLMAGISLMSTYIGTMLPAMHDIAIEMLPILQAGTYIIGMASGVVVIVVGVKRKRK